MTILRSDHLFEQADRLIAPTKAGPPRQVDLRRSVSASYYGLFHFILTSLADEFVGRSQRATGPYVLVYRSVDHRTLRETCVEARRRTPTARFQHYCPIGGFQTSLQSFASTVFELQERRLRADYNPGPRFVLSDAQAAVASARVAVIDFRSSSQRHRKAFLTLLLCPPR
jgi:hypothetical protein